jgi:RecA/RadA recombinase
MDDISMILSGELDYTEYFIDKEKSIKRLEKALRGRPKSLGFLPPDDFEENLQLVNMEIKEMKEKYSIEDPQD